MLPELPPGHGPSIASDLVSLCHQDQESASIPAQALMPKAYFKRPQIFEILWSSNGPRGKQAKTKALMHCKCKPSGNPGAGCSIRNSFQLIYVDGHC